MFVANGTEEHATSIINSRTRAGQKENIFPLQAMTAYLRERCNCAHSFRRHQMVVNNQSHAPGLFRNGNASK
jgi:hypothetical protein